jgi:hypothetical protein
LSSRTLRSQLEVGFKTFHWLLDSFRCSFFCYTDVDNFLKDSSMLHRLAIKLINSELDGVGVGGPAYKHI